MKEKNLKKLCNRRLFDKVLNTEYCDSVEEQKEYEQLVKELESRLKDWLAKPIWLK
jgi:hypothetical protein